MKLKWRYIFFKWNKLIENIITTLWLDRRRLDFFSIIFLNILLKNLLFTHVPQIKGRTVQEIIKEAKKHFDVQHFLSSLAKGKQIDRKFEWNIGIFLERFNRYYSYINIRQATQLDQEVNVNQSSQDHKE